MWYSEHEQEVKFSFVQDDPTWGPKKILALLERMHKTLKNEATIPPEKNLRAQQKRFDSFQREYNDIRHMPNPTASDREIPSNVTAKSHFD